MSEKHALISLLISVALYSLFPVFNALSVNEIPPFLYVAKASFFAGVIASILYWLIPSSNNKKTIIQNLKMTNYRWVILSASLATLAYVALVKSFYLASNTAVTIIYELWPILVLLMFPILHYGRFNTLKRIDLVAILLAIMGIYFILMSSDKDVNPFDMVFEFGSQIQGLLLALTASVTMAIAVLIKSKAMINKSTDTNDLGRFVSLEIVNRFAAAFFAGALSLIFESDSLSKILTLDSSLGFGIIEGIGGLLYWIALSKSRKTTILLLLYFSPLLSFVWLYLLGIAELSSTILFGAIMIFSANILVHYDKDRSLAFSITVFFSIVSCIYCYYTSGSEGILAFSLSTVPTTLFAILIGFMLQRVSMKDRIQQRLVMQLILSENSGLVTNEKNVFDKVLLDSFESNSWGNDDAEQEKFEKAVAKLDRSDKSLFENFLLSRNNPVQAGETMVLTLVGISAILATHLVRPTHFFGDFFPAVLTATIVYLCMTVVEQKNYLIKETLAGILKRHTGESTKLNHTDNEIVFAGLLLLSSVLTVFIITLLEKHEILSF